MKNVKHTCIDEGYGGPDLPEFCKACYQRLTISQKLAFLRIELEHSTAVKKLKACWDILKS